MDMTCNMAEDLLPLYLEDSCSQDSRAALEAHLKTCSACRARLERMGSGLADIAPVEISAMDLARYGKKVRRRRIRTAVLGILAAALASVLLALTVLTAIDMRREAHPYVHDVEERTWNLTAEELRAGAEEIGQYVFYTNYKQIQVTAEAEDDLRGTVLLWDDENSDSAIQTAHVGDGIKVCTFTNLSAARRYRITCQGLEAAAVTVSEGRRVSVWHSLRNVLGELG